jgi:hypothetical protein
MYIDQVDPDLYQIAMIPLGRVLAFLDIDALAPAGNGRDNLKALADALLGLSAEDRATLAELLGGSNGER